MDTNFLVNEIILGNNTLSEEGREEIIYELIDIHSRMPQPVDGVGIITFVNLSDKDLVLTLVTAYEIDAIQYFFNVNKKPYHQTFKR